MALANWNVALKAPAVLQYQRLLLELILVTNNVAGIRCGNSNHFGFDVVYEFASFNLRKRYVCAFLGFHFVIFACCRNAPATQAVDLLAGGGEVNNDRSVIAAVWTKNFIGYPDGGLDLV